MKSITIGNYTTEYECSYNHNGSYTEMFYTKYPIDGIITIFPSLIGIGNSCKEPTENELHEELVRVKEYVESN